MCMRITTDRKTSVRSDAAIPSANHWTCSVGRCADRSIYQRAFPLPVGIMSVSLAHRRGLKFLLYPQVKPIFLREDALFPTPKTSADSKFYPRSASEYNAIVTKNQEEEGKKQIENMRTATLRVLPPHLH